MKRLSLDAALALSMAVLPRLAGIGYEAGRMQILGAVVLVIAVLGHLRLITPAARRIGALAVAATLLACGWLESFPAGSHSGEIGFYILFGAAALVLAVGMSADTTELRHAPRNLSAA